MFYPRKIYTELKKHLEKKEISLILGPRQAGKTTLMLRLKKELEKKGESCVYFNLDLIEEISFFKTQHYLIREVEKRIGKRGYVFIDEIQRLKNAGVFLKGLFDMNTGYKFIVSGSGALELKADIIEPLTGRKRVFYCFPLDFTEFVAGKMGVDFKEVEEVLEQNPFEMERMVKEYLTFGGYPRVVLAPTYEEKLEVLQEIYSSYLHKDIKLLLKVEKEYLFTNLFRIVAEEVGSIVNLEAISRDIGGNVLTLKKYLYFLEKTFVLSLVKPFFTNVRKEIRKVPKVYFNDLGLLNLARGRLTPNLKIDGALFENACFLRLKELNLFEPIRFWRSRSGAEVDFIVRKGEELFPVEVKLSFSGKVLGKSLFSFIRNYKPSVVYFYNLFHKKEFEREGVKIKVIPYYFLPEIK